MLKVTLSRTKWCRESGSFLYRPSDCRCGTVVPQRERESEGVSDGEAVVGGRDGSTVPSPATLAGGQPWPGPAQAQD